MTEDVTKIRADLLAVKGRASELSGEIDRQKKIIGTQANELEQAQADAAKAAKLKDELAAANAKVAQLEAALKTADALVATAKEAVLAAKQISDALTKLSSL